MRKIRCNVIKIQAKKIWKMQYEKDLDNIESLKTIERRLRKAYNRKG